MRMIDTHIRNIITRNRTPAWRVLNMTDVCASANLAGATRFTKKGYTFINVQVGNTPTASVAMGQSGEFAILTTGFPWNALTESLTTLFRSTVTGFWIYYGHQVREVNGSLSDLEGSTTLTGSFDETVPEVYFLSWDNPSISFYRNTDLLESGVASDAFRTPSTATIGHDGSGREVKAPISIYHRSTPLTESERQRFVSEALRVAA